MLQLFSVLWAPRKSFSRLSLTRMSWLVFLFIAIELVCCLIGIGQINFSITKAIDNNAALGVGARPILMSFVILTSSLINIVISAIMAIVFSMVTFALGGEPRYRITFGMLLLSFSPILLNHFTRNVFYLFGWIDNPGLSVLSMKNYILISSESLLGRMIAVFDLFDIWTLVLVIIGYSLTSGLKKIVALPTAVIIWLSLQMVFLRIQSIGATQ